MVISFFMSPASDHIRNFMQYLQFQKRYSSHTIVSYETDLEAFSTFLDKVYEIQEPANATATFIRSWLADLRSNNLTSRTINRKISALRSFYKYLLRNKVIEATPMAAISTPKNAKRLPQYVDERDMAVLFTHVEFPDNFTGVTERIILEILYNAGLRQAELIGLKDQHIDYAGAIIKVMGKGSKERMIPVSRQLVESMAQYREQKMALFGNGSLQLLCNEKGIPLTPKFVYNVVRKYLSLVTTIEKRSPHVMRHSFATHLTNNGADINAIKELLGHSSLAATQVYTHNSIERLKEAYKKAHPKA